MIARFDQRAVRKGRRMFLSGTVLTSVGRARARSELGALAVGGAHDGLDTAAHAATAHHLYPARPAHGHHVVENAVGDVFVEGALVPVGPDVELDALELDQVPVGDVPDPDGGKVRLARLGAQAGELRDLERDLVVAVGVRIWDDFELLARPGRHAPILPRGAHRPGAPDGVAGTVESLSRDLLEEDDARSPALHSEAAHAVGPRDEPAGAGGGLAGEL